MTQPLGATEKKSEEEITSSSVGVDFHVNGTNNLLQLFTAYILSTFSLFLRFSIQRNTSTASTAQSRTCLNLSFVLTLHIVANNKSISRQSGCQTLSVLFRLCVPIKMQQTSAEDAPFRTDRAQEFSASGLPSCR